MNSELSRETFVAICDRIFDRFRRGIDVFALRFERYPPEFPRVLHKLWLQERHPDEVYSPAVTIAAHDAMRALVDEYVNTTNGDYQQELRRLECDAEALRDRFAEKFNDNAAALFEMELNKVAYAARQQGYLVEMDKRASRDSAIFYSDRPAFERTLDQAGLPVTRDSALYAALHEFFQPHFEEGSDDSLPPEMRARLEQGQKERDPSLN